MTLTPTAVHCLEADAAALIRRLARPAPASIPFTEVRYSRLFKEPLIVSGELSYQDSSTLDRRVTQPYKEETQIRGESVRVQREGEAARSFGLKRSPELRGLVAGIGALLSGDPNSLEGIFNTVITQEPGGWKLELAPTDARLRKRLSQLAIHGREDTPRCLVMLTSDDGASVMLLGETSKVPLAKNVSRDSILQRCAGGA